MATVSNFTDINVYAEQVKVAAKLSMCLMKQHATKTCGCVGKDPYNLLTQALIEREWLASRPDRFVAGERDHGTHWIEG